MEQTLALSYSTINSQKLIGLNSLSLSNGRMRPIDEIRHENLLALIALKGGQRQFADAAGIKNPAQVSQWVNRSKNAITGKPRVMSGATARAIEIALGLPDGWMDTANDPDAVSVAPVHVAGTETGSGYVRIQQIDAEAGMGGEVVNDDYPDVIRAMDFTQEYIRGIVGFVPPPGRLILMTGRGDSMVPTIQPGDTVVVDTGVTSFDGDGLYLINMGSGHQIKRLVDRGRVHVASDNRAYGEPFPIPEGTVVGGKVYLRTRIERFN